MEQRRERLKAWVTDQHHEQRRKDGEYYPNHLVRVAEMARGYTKLGYEIGLCHDLVEDTQWTTRGLWEQLLSFGYNLEETEDICKAVHYLTDVYTSDNYPWLNREQRKRLEAERLAGISDKDAITVKYCDLIDNISSAQNLDGEFRLRYLEEKARVVEMLDQGDTELYKKVQQTLAEALDK